jgi:D-Lysine 5,6-aminomutase alpha subunit.
MQKSKLGLDFEKVEYARGLAKNIAENVQAFVEQYTTVAVERTLCRLMGIDGVDENQVPLPNIVIDALKDKGVLNEGVLFLLPTR